MFALAYSMVRSSGSIGVLAGDTITVLLSIPIALLGAKILCAKPSPSHSEDRLFKGLKRWAKECSEYLGGNLPGLHTPFPGKAALDMYR